MAAASALAGCLNRRVPNIPASAAAAPVRNVRRVALCPRQRPVFSASISPLRRLHAGRTQACGTILLHQGAQDEPFLRPDEVSLRRWKGRATLGRPPSLHSPLRANDPVRRCWADRTRASRPADPECARPFHHPGCCRLRPLPGSTLRGRSSAVQPMGRLPHEQEPAGR